MDRDWMNRLAILTDSCEESLKIRGSMMVLDLFDRFSFNVETGCYWVYLKPVTKDKVMSLKTFLDQNNYRLVTYQI